MSNQLAEKKPSRDIKSLLNSESMKKQFAAALPRHLSPDRFIRVATTALMRTPALADCTPESFMKCMLELSAWGIEPDGRRAHLIPFKNNQKNVTECTLILDWKGLAELAMRSGLITKLHADVICENDEFEYNLGEIVVHRIDFKTPRGEPYAAYARAVTKDGATFVAVMSKDDVQTIRNNSQGYKAAIRYNKDHPWISSEFEMWKKTAFRRLAKWLPLSAEFREASDKDDASEFGDLRNVTPPQQQIENRTNPYGEFPTITEPETVEEIPATEPEPTPAETQEPPDDAERFALIDELREKIRSAEITTATFEAKARVAKVIKRGLGEATMEELQIIADNFDAIVAGKFGEVAK